MSYYQISKIAQFCICVGLSLFLLSFCPWPWLRELLAVIVAWRVFGFLRKRFRTHRRAKARLSAQVRLVSLDQVMLVMLFGSVMSFFVIVAAVL